MTTTSKGTSLKKVDNKSTAANAKSTTPKAQATTPETKEQVKAEVTKRNVTNLVDLDRSLFVKKNGAAGRDSMIKPEFLKDKSEKDKRKLRREIRTNLHRFAISFKEYKSENNTKKLKELKELFVTKFYTKYFISNDLTPQSVMGGNTKEDNKEELIEMFKIILEIK